MEVDWEGRSPFEDPPITTRSGSFSASLRSSDPFASPSSEAPSPVSPVPLDTETESRRMSEISQLDHREEG